MTDHQGQVVRVAEHQGRRTATFQAQCTCGWRSPSIVTPPGALGSAQLEAPTTQDCASRLAGHLRVVGTDTLLGVPGSPTHGGKP